LDGWDEVRSVTNLAGHGSSELIRRSTEQLVSPEVLLEGIHRSAAVRAQVGNGPLPPFGGLRIGFPEGASEAWPPTIEVPADIAPRLCFRGDLIRSVLPPAGPFGLRDMRVSRSA
jgi:hypothetical protein